MNFKYGITYIFKNTIDTIINVNAKAPVVIRKISLEEVRTVIPLIRTMNESKYEQFEKRIRLNGDSCFVAYIGNEPVHFSWVRSCGIMDVSSARRSYLISSESAWIFDCRTSDDFRGLGIYPFVLCQLCKELLEQKNQVYIDTSRSNVSSVAGICKAGFTVVSTVYRLGPLAIGVPSKLK